MDYLRVLKVPIQPAVLLLIGIVTPIATFFVWSLFRSPSGLIGVIGLLFLQLWVFKYCYVLLERIADGAGEPPVLDNDMLSPFETRPWVQLALLCAGGLLCWYLGGAAGIALAVVLILWIPASVAMLGFGESFWQPLNPLKLFRLVRGLGVHYLVLLAAMGLGALLVFALVSVSLPLFLKIALLLLYEVTFFALVGGVLFMRREKIGYEPSRSPERTEAREESERAKVLAQMIDEMFGNVRIGKHVDATRPFADWLDKCDAEEAIRDCAVVIEQALRWKSAGALNTIGSTAIRHLLRFGRPDAALRLFERLRGQSAGFTMDSAPDLRTLAEYAESIGRDDLAESMRLETPVFHPPRA